MAGRVGIALTLKCRAPGLAAQCDDAPEERARPESCQRARPDEQREGGAGDADGSERDQAG